MDESGRVAVDDGVQIAYTLRGPQTSPALLFCPGLGATQLGYAADAAYFAGRERRTLTFDLRGSGRSSTPRQMAPASFTIARLADDVIQLLDAREMQTVDVVGHSLGGVVGLELVSRAPSRVRSLITYGTTYRINWPWISLMALNLFYRLAGTKLHAALIAKVSTYEHTRALIKTMLAEFPVSASNHIRRGIRSYDYLATAVSWPGPILLIRGSLDRAVNRSLGPTLAALERKPNFHLAELEGAGHYTNLDKPREARELMTQFLERSKR